MKRLAAGEPSETPDADARLALTALMVRIAKSNYDYADIEIERIDEIVMRRYGLSADEAEQLREQAEDVEIESHDTVRFTRAIKDAVAHEDRNSVIEALWELVLADGERSVEEDGLMRLIAPLLGVNDRDSALARQRVQARMA